MAIIEDVPGIEISIAVAGATATEYADPELDEIPKDNNCFLSSVYLECLDNQEFAFRYQVDSTYDWGYKDHQLSFKFYIGGKLCDRRPTIQHTATRSGPITRELKNQVEYNEATKKWYKHKFVFTAVEKVDDANKKRVEDDKKIAKHLGVLKVEVWRVTVHTYDKQPPPKTGASSSSSARGIPPIAEKALKGREISHGAGLDEGEVIEYKPSQNTSGPRTWYHRLPEDNGPMAVYLFHYRSKEALKKERIIARSLSPSPIPGGSSEKDKKPAVKRERSDTFDFDNEATVKSRRKRPKPEDEEEEELPVVDLTGSF
ncbi:hypothetical protein PG993_012710 [Apiospora rasikravindrae]|uniref:DUF7918 domain-containing protein n=1 Tax=Apiospora rasikravindrae TaxID=990691 RepID=A0ABR1S391_9PEZI